MHLYVQAPFWSAVVAESTVMWQHPKNPRTFSSCTSAFLHLGSLSDDERESYSFVAD
jgi:hypothetical protein